MAAPLVESLKNAEKLHGEEWVAEQLGIKVRMWQYVREGRYGLSLRMLRSVRKNLPSLRDEIDDYLLRGADETRAVA